MKETILVKQVHLPIEKHEVALSDVEIPSSEGQTVCGHLQIITKTKAYVKIRANENDKKFRLVFFRNNNVMALTVAYRTMTGNEYQVTAREGYSIGILCVV